MEKFQDVDDRWVIRVHGFSGIRHNFHVFPLVFQVLSPNSRGNRHCIFDNRSSWVQSHCAGTQWLKPDTILRINFTYEWCRIRASWRYRMVCQTILYWLSNLSNWIPILEFHGILCIQRRCVQKHYCSLDNRIYNLSHLRMDSNNESTSLSLVRIQIFSAQIDQCTLLIDEYNQLYLHPPRMVRVNRVTFLVGQIRRAQKQLPVGSWKGSGYTETSQ